VAQPSAPSECASVATTQSKAADTIRRWESDTQIKLTSDARSGVLASYCQAVKHVIAADGITEMDIDVATPAVMTDYLDRNAAASGRVISLETLLQSSLSRGPSNPAFDFQQMGVLRVNYVKSPDYLMIGTEHQDLSSAYMVKLGTVTISGYQQKTLICTGSVTVRSVGSAVFTC
jgi:hypothetical protein